LVALDVFEHAYFIDFGTNKGGYIDAFFRNLDWRAVAKRAEAFGIFAHAKV
jgi:Fe-Mn family superoxide dismutase